MTYFELAGRILAGSHPSIADVSPVYLGLIVALRFLGASVATIRTLQLAMLVAAALFCALAAKRLGGPIAAVAAAVLILGNRAAWVVCAELDPKALIFLLTSAALWCLLRGSNIAAGLLLGLNAATHPYGYALLLIAVLWSAATASRRFPLFEDTKAATRRLSRNFRTAGVAPAERRRPAGAYWGGRSTGQRDAAPSAGGTPAVRQVLRQSPRRRRTPYLATALIPIVAVLVFSPVENHSGVQFFEGNNALATGCAGVTPRAVIDLQVQRGDPSPDPAYRILASGDRTFWRDQALAFIRAYPGVALKRFATKALLTIHHFDVHDVVTAQRRNLTLARYPAIGFGLAFVLAVAALVLSPNRRALLLPTLFAVAMIVLLTVFVVSARQRNVLLAPLAILGGAGAAQIVALFRRRMEHGLLAFGAVLIATALLGIETAPMREYDHMWRLALRRPVDPQSPAARFDRAIDLERAGRWREADAILATLGDYRPMRQATAVSSVAYYRARAALAAGRPADAFLARAAVEAPGDPNVLALRHGFSTGSGSGTSGARR